MRWLVLAAGLLASSAFAQDAMLIGAGSPSKVAAGPAGYQGPGDVTGWTTGAVAFYSLRGVTSSFSGAVFRVCDVAVGTTCADATWATTSGVGTLTIPNILGSPCNNSTNQCEISEFYDQIGTACTGGCSVTAGHNARMILTINCLGTLPCANSTINSNYVSANTTTSAIPQALTNTAVAERTGTGQMTIAAWNGSNVIESLFASAAGSVGAYTGASVITAPGATDNVAHTLQFLFNGGSSEIYVDATPNTPLSLGNSNGIPSGANAFLAFTSGQLVGNFFEAGWWSGDRSPNFNDMHLNQCHYWGTSPC